LNNNGQLKRRKADSRLSPGQRKATKVWTPAISLISTHFN
jgi:hypothetical protein